jgi:hypothetical protein
LAQVDRLLPGVTTVTPHARYYMVHALVAAESRRRDLVPAETEELLRRVEVVFGAISSVHQDPHPGWSRAHGADKITESLAGGLDVEALSRRNVYAQANLGFWGPYFASEILLRLVEVQEAGRRPGPALDEDAVFGSLGDLLDLAGRDYLDESVLASYQHLCLCGSRSAPDGQLLRDLLVARDAEAGSFDDHRRQTIRIVSRLIQLFPPANAATDLWPKLVYGELGEQDPALATLPDTPRWRATALRAQSVAAWRGLWAWLVNEQINGLTPRAALADALADTMPAVTVSEFIGDLPPTVDTSGTLLPAELDDAITGRPAGYWQFSVLALGAQRFDTLPDAMLVEFEGRQEAGQELTPGWLYTFLQDRSDRHLPDVGHELVHLLIDRSQRIALRKARYVLKEAQFKIPTRVYLRDDAIWRDSDEGGGGISLRWGQLVTVLSGVGVYDRTPDGRWVVTDIGESILA